MDEQLRALQRRVDADPLDPEPAHQLARLHERRGGLIQGRGLSDWVSELVSEDEAAIDAAFEALMGCHPYSVLALPAILARFGRSRRWGDVLELIERRGRWSLPFLIEALDHEQYLVRSRAVEGLGALEGLALPALGSLAGALDDAHAWVRHKAVEAVGRLGPGASALAPQVRPLLDADDPALVLKAAVCLRGLDPGFDLDAALHEVLSRGGPAARRSAREVLARSPVADVDGLIEAQSRRVAHGELRDAAAALIVLESLARGSGSEAARRAFELAQERLSGVDQADAAPELVALLDDDHYLVRHAAYASLARLAQEHDAALPGLLAAAFSSDAWVRRAAAQTLSQLGQRGLELVKKLRQHSDQRLRWWAVQQLQRLERERGERSRR